MDGLNSISLLTPNYSVRNYQEGDDENIVSLLDLVFNGWPKYDLPVSNLDHWKWKYMHKKWIDNSIVVGVNKNKEIVGCSHNPFIKAIIGGVEEDIQLGVDLAVHQSYRKMGMSYKMDSILPNNYVSYWSTSNPIVKNMSLYSASEKLSRDICFYFKIDELFKIIRVGFLIVTILEVIYSANLKPINTIVLFSPFYVYFISRVLYRSLTFFTFFIRIDALRHIY